MSVRFIRTNSEVWNTIDHEQYRDCIVFIEDTKCIWVNNIEYNSESIDTSDFYNKDQVDKNIEEVAFIAANAIHTIKNTIGADDNLKVHFEGTQHFQECNSLVDAIYKVDNELVPKNELYNILESLFNGMNYGSGGESGSPIGDFEEVEETENVESVELEDDELTQ